MSRTVVGFANRVGGAKVLRWLELLLHTLLFRQNFDERFHLWLALANSSRTRSLIYNLIHAIHVRRSNEGLPLRRPRITELERYLFHKYKRCPLP